MKKRMDTIDAKAEIVKDLKKEYKKVEKENDKVENQRAYVNLPITLLERTFFDIVAKEVFNLDQTKLLRSIIRKLMVRHPECVKKAKRVIRENEK